MDDTMTLQSAKSMIMEQVHRSGGEVQIPEGYESTSGVQKLLGLDGHMEHSVFKLALDELIAFNEVELRNVDGQSVLRASGM